MENQGRVAEKVSGIINCLGESIELISSLEQKMSTLYGLYDKISAEVSGTEYGQ